MSPTLIPLRQLSAPMETRRAMKNHGEEAGANATSWEGTLVKGSLE